MTYPDDYKGDKTPCFQIPPNTPFIMKNDPLFNSSSPPVPAWSSGMYHRRALLRGGKATTATSPPSFPRSLLQALPRFLQALSIGGPPSSPRPVPSSVQSSEATGIETSIFIDTSTATAERQAELLLEKLQDDLSAPWENNRGNDAWIRPDWSFLDSFPAISNAPLPSHIA